MILAILLLPSIAWSQSVSSGTQTNVAKHEGIITNDQQITTGRLNALELGVKELQNGRPTITGIPTFSQGASFTGNTTASSGTTVSGPLTVTSSATFSGTVAITSGAIVSGAPTNISTPTANGLYKNNIVGAWAVFVGTGTGNMTILGGYNVDYVSRTGTGTYTVHFGTPFASLYSYTCTCAPGYTAGVNSCRGLQDNVDQTASAYQLAISQAGVGAVDSARVSVICAGSQ